MYSKNKKSDPMDILLAAGDYSLSESDDEQPENTGDSDEQPASNTKAVDTSKSLPSKEPTKEPTGGGRKHTRRTGGKSPNRDDDDSETSSHDSDMSTSDDSSDDSEIPQPPPIPGPAARNTRNPRLRDLRNYFRVHQRNVTNGSGGRKHKLPSPQDEGARETGAPGGNKRQRKSQHRHDDDSEIPQPPPIPQLPPIPQPPAIQQAPAMAGPAAPAARNARVRALQDYFAEPQLNINNYSRSLGG